MSSAINDIRDTVSIEDFNHGHAEQIFEDVKANGPKVVMKDNAAECVLLSPDLYDNIMDELNDACLMAIATERLAHLDMNTLISEAEFWERLHITQEDLDAIGEVELE